MAEKGSKYARKHNLVEESQDTNTDAAEDKSFLSVIYDDVSFLQTFDELSFSEQIKAYRTLKKLAEPKKHNSMSASDKILAKNSEYKLEKINIFCGLKLEEKTHYALSQDELHVIRMDCYGAVDARPSHQLSKYYKHFIHNRLAEVVPPKKYDLSKAPAWKVFRQFKNFRNIESDIKKYMSRERFNPEALKLMEVKDFSDMIFKTFQDNNKYGKAFFLKKDSPRNTFVKKVARKFEKQIVRILREEGQDERYIQSLLSAMKHYGTTDSDKIVITELEFTPRILTDLNKAGISCEDYHLGEKIPSSLVADLMREDKGYLLAARDENGHTLSGSQFPSFEVHHKTAVMESNSLAFIAMVNYEDNYLLVPYEIHCHVLHGFDRLNSSAHKESYHRRLELINNDTTAMLGFNKQTHIHYDWSHSKAYQKRMKEDAEHIVSYDEVMAQLATNRQNYLNQTKAIEFDVDSVVQIIRHKRGIDSEELIKRSKELKKAEKKQARNWKDDNIETLDEIIYRRKSQYRKGRR